VWIVVVGEEGGKGDGLTLALEVGKGWVGLRGAVWVDMMSVEMI
jgi:hypothetical protein